MSLLLLSAVAMVALPTLLLPGQLTEAVNQSGFTAVVRVGFEATTQKKSVARS
jgi:hypothetical protein